MRALAPLLLLASCARPGPYVCATDPDCGDGFCEADGLCSVADAACPSGRRYGELAGGAAGTCVDGGQTMPADETALCGVTAARPDGSGACAELVCAADPSCCETSWDLQCARMAEARCELACEEIVAAGGYQLAAVFPLDTPRSTVWSENHFAWNYEPAWGDLDGDGLADLVIAREGDDQSAIPGLAILESSGSSGGALVLTAASIGGDFVTWTHDVELRDFDADGDLDVLASGPGGIWVVVTEDHTYTAHQLATSQASATWIASSSSPPWKIAATYAGMPPRIVVETFDETFTITDSTMLGQSEDELTWCHVAGTPERDLIVGDNLFVANATGFAPPTEVSASGYLPACADLDGDGDNDLVMGDYDGLKIILNQGGLTTPPIEFSTLIIGGIAIADFDDNGLLDVLATSATNMRVEVPLYFFDHQTTGFEKQDLFPDWNTIDLDSYGVDVGRPPRTP